MNPLWAHARRAAVSLLTLIEPAATTPSARKDRPTRRIQSRNQRGNGNHTDAYALTASMLASMLIAEMFTDLRTNVKGALNGNRNRDSNQRN